MRQILRLGWRRNGGAESLLLFSNDFFIKGRIPCNDVVVVVEDDEVALAAGGVLAAVITGGVLQDVRLTVWWGPVVNAPDRPTRQLAANRRLDFIIMNGAVSDDAVCRCGWCVFLVDGEALCC
jgi:hypothetical protein